MVSVKSAMRASVVEHRGIALEPAAAGPQLSNSALLEGGHGSDDVDGGREADGTAAR